MHIRRLATLILGAWFGASLFMIAVASQNLRAVDRMMESPSVVARIEINQLGADDARLFLRHLASEQNRWYFAAWEWVQFGLGILLLIVLFFAVTGDLSVLLFCLLMLVLVAGQRLVLTPELTRVGRLIDFLPSDQLSVDRTRFFMLHTIYGWVELAKMVLGAVLSFKILKRRRSHSQERALPEGRDLYPGEVDLVDEPDHGGVDR